jgi:hypothetical protein
MVRDMGLGKRSIKAAVKYDTKEHSTMAKK